MAQIRPIKLKSGATSYEVRIHRKGEKARSKSFSGADAKELARKWANAEEARIDKGDAMSGREAERITVDQVCAEFIADYKPKGWKPSDDKFDADKKRLPRITDVEERQTRSVGHDFRTIKVSELTHQKIANWIERLGKTVIPKPLDRKKIHYLYGGAEDKVYSPATVRKHYFQLKKVVEWHAFAKYALEPTLFKNQVIPAAWSGQRERRLEVGEEEKIYASIDRGYTNRQAWRNLVGIALETGMRAQEMLKAKWRDVDLVERNWHIPKENVKTKTSRNIPLSVRALEILKAMHAEKKGELLWPDWRNTTTLALGFRRITHRMGLSVRDLTLHDLRHEAISRFFERERLSDIDIMKISGHTNFDTLARYVVHRKSKLADKMG